MKQQTKHMSEESKFLNTQGDARGEEIRIVKRCFESANILEVSVEHNGFRGGDAGHGGYVKIAFEDIACTSMNAFVEDHDECGDVKRINMLFRGSCERETLLEGLKMIVKELEENH